MLNFLKQIFKKNYTKIIQGNYQFMDQSIKVNIF
jgi:hypothetical protein